MYMYLHTLIFMIVQIDKEFLLLEISANQYIILVEVEKSSVAEVNN